jgi:hypothetical protein
MSIKTNQTKGLNMSIERLEYKGNSRTEAHALVDFIDESYLVILTGSVLNELTPHLKIDKSGEPTQWANWFTGLKLGGFITKTSNGKWLVRRGIVCNSITECCTLISGNQTNRGLSPKGKTHISTTPSYQKILQDHIEKRS